MAENRENPAESVRTLSLLVEQNGIPWVAEAQQVGEDPFLDMLDDNVEMDDATEANLMRLCDSVESGLEFIGSVGACPAGDTTAIVGVDLDGDGEYDVELAGVGMVAPTQSRGEEIERKRISLRSARALALTSQFWLGMKYQERVAALGLVTQIELALISVFHELAPEPGVAWDGERRAREIERRLSRLRWVEREQEREYGGLKGVWNRLVGRHKVSGKELYQRMLREADGMLEPMQMGEMRPTFRRK